MNVVFFGSSDFSRAPLEALHRSRHKLVGVVTVPAAKKGRGQKIKSTEIYDWAERAHVPVWAPPRLKDEAFQDELCRTEADLFLVASYGKLVPECLLEMPKYFSLNIHPSLLPRYRGAAPLHWQILNGDRECGVTFFRMTAKMDAGDMVWQKRFPLEENETAGELGERLSRAAAASVSDVLDSIEKGNVKFAPQDEHAVSIARKIEKADGVIDWTRPARAIHNRVRGLSPRPGAQSIFRNKPVKILETRLTGEDANGRAGGAILNVSGTEGLRVAAGDEIIFVRNVQKAGKRAVTGAEFANGERITPDEKFG